MISLNPNVRSFLSSLGAAVPVSIGWAWYKTTDKVEQFSRVEQSFAVLTGVRIAYELAKRGRYFTAVILGTVSAVAIKQALEKSSVGIVRSLLATAMIVAFAVEWFTKDSVVNPMRLHSRAASRPNSDYLKERVEEFEDGEVLDPPLDFEDGEVVDPPLDTEEIKRLREKVKATSKEAADV